MRVLHFMWTFSPLTETFIYDVVQETALRADVLVVTRRRVNAQERPFQPVALARSRALGKLRDRLLAPFSPDPTPLPVWVGVRRGLRAAARSFRPDVIHAQFGDMGVLAEPVARELGVPLLTTFHGVDGSQLLRDPRWRRWFLPLAAGRNRAIAVAGAMRAALIEAGLDGERISVVLNGKRLQSYPFRERTRPPTRLVTVGRIVEKKGHLDAVAAVARLVAEGHPLELEIVGEGPLAAAVQERAAALGIAERVRLTGALDHDATRARMEASDAFLLCSRTSAAGDAEGLPMVLLEAQALGLPCVSTFHAGIPEAIPAENHWLLAPEGNVEAVAAALRRLRQATPQQLAETSRRGLAQVRAHHDVSRQADRLIELYRAAAAGVSPSPGPSPPETSPAPR